MSEFGHRAAEPFGYVSPAMGHPSRRARRTELELVAEVLLCLDRGITNTSGILRHANLTYGRFAEIAATLERQGLVRRIETGNGRPAYAIETKGRQFLVEFRSFRHLFETTYGFEL